MLPIIPKPAVTPGQKKAALVVAGVVDFLQIGFFPWFMEGALSPFNDALDFIAAGVMIAICGFKWQFILAFALELTPLVDLFPTWTAVALTLSTHAEPARSRVNPTYGGPPTSPPVQRGAHQPIEVSAVVVPPVQERGEG